MESTRKRLLLAETCGYSEHKTHNVTVTVYVNIVAQ